MSGRELRMLSDGWHAAATGADLHSDPAQLAALEWIPAQVPGTAAGALRDSGMWRAGQPYDFDAEDWWFRTSFDVEPVDPSEQLILHLDGIATLAEVYLNGELVLESDSMFAAHELNVSDRVKDTNELAIRCRALSGPLRVRRRPRARWRTRLVYDGGLRFFRTMLLGRAPGFAPGPAAVGPWRPVSLERRRRLAVEELTLRPRIDGEDGVLRIHVRVRVLDESSPQTIDVQLDGPSGAHRTSLAMLQAVRGLHKELVADGELIVPEVARWWPHTHGEPALHEVRLLVRGPRESTTMPAGRVGFRELAAGSSPQHELERDGLDLHVNGEAIFVRGAVWTPADLIAMAPSEDDLRARLGLVRDAGMNMLRIPGTAAYETSAFHDICDELGIMVWQDFMFANLDYPIADDGFRNTVRREVRAQLELLGGRPSLAVLCGNSEIEQQVAMLGLDPALGRGELFGELLPELIADSATDAIYVPSAPCGGELPFRPGRGIANYYGVGSYRRGLEDARRADVRFAAECLAFSNVPDTRAIEDMLAPGQLDLAIHHPTWKAGVPRDAGAGWDFEDVRDHYLQTLYGLDVRELRRVDQERYLELSRMLTGEIMAEVFGEWRRGASSCGGGLVLWLGDLLPGAGWGLLDHRGEPKLVYHHLRRAFAPVAVWTVDEGLGGVVAHVANDLPRPLEAELRIALYSDGERLVGEGSAQVALAPNGQAEWNIETVLGRFADVGWSYRFGPPAQDAIVVSLLERDAAGTSTRLVSQAVRFPAGRPLHREPPEHLGLTASARTLPDGTVELELASRRLVYGVRVEIAGYLPSDDCFTLEPGVARLLALFPRDADSSLGEATVRAVNMSGHVRATLEA